MSQPILFTVVVESPLFGVLGLTGCLGRADPEAILQNQWDPLFEQVTGPLGREGRLEPG